MVRQEESEEMMRTKEMMSLTMTTMTTQPLKKKMTPKMIIRIKTKTFQC